MRGRYRWRIISQVFRDCQPDRFIEKILPNAHPADISRGNGEAQQPPSTPIAAKQRRPTENPTPPHRKDIPLHPRLSR
jgi:hypothetical protein